MVSATFSEKEVLVTNKLDLSLKKKLVMCYIASLVLYGAERGTAEVDHICLASCKMWSR
jgi:hypothetical protein